VARLGAARRGSSAALSRSTSMCAKAKGNAREVPAVLAVVRHATFNERCRI